MLLKKHRLTKTKDWQKILKEGKRAGCDFLAIKFLENNLSCSRFGISVGGRISKKASERNKIRRRIREILRSKLKNIKPGIDLVIIAQPPIFKKNFQEIDEGLIKLFKRIELLQ